MLACGSRRSTRTLYVMKAKLLAVASLVLCSAAHAQPLGPPVGKVPAKCPATIEKASDFVPNPKLKLSPEEAVTAAETAHRVRCNSKLLQEVFADAENYYITR